jgi:hypothetical protein
MNHIFTIFAVQILEFALQIKKFLFIS